MRGRVMFPGGPGPSGESRNCGVRAATRPHLRIEERELEAGVAYKATSEEAAASEPTES